MARTFDFNIEVSGNKGIKNVQGKIEDKIFKIRIDQRFKTILNFELIVVGIGYDGNEDTWFNIWYVIYLPDGDKICNQCVLEDFLKLVIL